MLEFGLQATILFQYLVHLLWISHGMLETLQLGFQLAQRFERQQTFLPQGMGRFKPRLLCQVTDRQVARLADHPGRRFLLPGQDAQQGGFTNAVRTDDGNAGMVRNAERDAREDISRTKRFGQI